MKRTLLYMLLLLLAVGSLRAQTKPSGAGTAASPFEVSSFDELKWATLFLNNQRNTDGISFGGNTKYYFRLTADIDCGGQTIIPMGSGNWPFKGVFDGQAHTISNFVIDWSNTRWYKTGLTEEHSNGATFGLFGVLGPGSVVRYLTIDGARLTQTTTITENSQDYKIGVLAGTILPGAKVHDVSVLGASIDDGGNARKVRSLFVGGLIGDMVVAYSSFTSMFSADPINVDRVYVQCDVSLPNITHSSAAIGASSSQYTQFNVGGILGRMRRAAVKQLPHTTLFSGTVNAPLFTISPFFGLWRGNVASNAVTEMTQAYAGEYQYGDANEDYKVAGSADGDYPGSPNAIDEGHYYYGYRIVDGANGTVEINATTPSADNCAFGTRTLRANGALSGTFNNTQNSDMRLFQGVNRGVYAAAPASLKGEFNAGEIAGVKYCWRYDATAGVMRLMKGGTAIAAERSSIHSYTATLTNVLPEDVNAYTVKWYAIKDDAADRIGDVLPAEWGWDQSPQSLADGTMMSASFSITKAMYDGHGCTEYNNGIKRVLAVLCDTDGHPLAADGTVATTEAQRVQSYVEVQETSIDIARTIVHDGNGKPTHIRYEAQMLADERDFATEQAAASELSYSWTLTGAAAGTQHEYTALPATSSRQLALTVTDRVTNQTFTSEIEVLPCVMTVVLASNASGVQTYRARITDGHGTNWTGTPSLNVEWLLKCEATGNAFVSKSTDPEYIFASSSMGDTDMSYTVRAVVTDNYAGSPALIDEYDYERLFLYIDNTVAQQLRAHIYYSSPQDGQYRDYEMTGLGEWKWYYNTDPTNDSGWIQVQDNFTDLINGIDPEKVVWYRCEWHVASSNTTLSSVVGMVKVVFVYDKATTDMGRTKGFTTFDGTYNGEVCPTGNDRNDGATPMTAVRTMKRAFELLDSDPAVVGMHNMEHNRIVVMGYLQDVDFLRYTRHDLNEYLKPATITGEYGQLKDGSLFVANTAQGEDGGGAADPLAMQAPLQFRDITWVGNTDVHKNANELYFNCYNNDLIMDRGVRIRNYKNIGGDMGLITGSTMPSITIVAGRHDENALGYEITYSPYNAEEGITNISIKSGCYGRVIGGSRNNRVNANTHNISGHPDKPHRAKIEINIAHDPDAAGVVHNNEYTPGKTYTCDIGLVTGGQTDGSCYGDCNLIIRSGRIGRYISGCITYGRQVSGANPTMLYPDDSFFGRTVVDIHGGTVEELYGGSLGRFAISSTGIERTKAYFYGTSIINLYGGTVKSNIYASGAGGVAGLGYDWGIEGVCDHTNDLSIPYYKTGDASHTVYYGDYDAVMSEGAMPTMLMRDGTVINLAQSHAEVNLYGGVVEGSVYGGGYGYSNQMDIGRIPIEVHLDADNDTTLCIGMSGNLYGTSRVTMQTHPVYHTSAVVRGNLYGGGAGSDIYERTNTKSYYDLKQMALLFGDTEVDLQDGVVEGNVYGGACGVDGYPNMAVVYGNTNLTISGSFEVKGNIFGGGALSDVRHIAAHDATESGNSNVMIDGGVIGNCIFGGGEGIEPRRTRAGMSSDITGDSHVTITGGSFSTEPYIIGDGGSKTAKGFNIYGGGYMNSNIGGNSYVTIHRSLLNDRRSMPAPEALLDESGNELPGITNSARFTAAWNDITYRHFCVYGGGWGSNTVVKGDSYVDVDVYLEGGFTVPSADPISFRPGQHLFDVAGGGYNGNIGYFDKEDRPKTNRFIDPYRGGRANVTIQGNTFMRKVVGGGFYADCKSTNIHALSGTMQEIYGGSTMGYVYESANLVFGTSLSNGDKSPESEQSVVAELNSRLFVLGNVYGGNDVKGIVGVDFWRDNEGNLGIEESDGGPLYTSCTDSTRFDRGVHIWMRGGTVCGDVYGAGNGHYRGYYVPDWTRYNEGSDRQYRYVRSWDGTTYEDDSLSIVTNASLSDVQKEAALDRSRLRHRIYRTRPMTGLVRMFLSGNSTSDRLTIRGNFYGGGRTCTIGAWNTVLPFEDPRRLVKGGYLHINFSSHITAGNVYLGSRGELLHEQRQVPAGIDLHTFDGSKTAQLDQLASSAYGHWWFNPTAPNWRDPSKTGRYEPGFPIGNQIAGNSGLYGEHMHRGYMKNVEMNGDIELTFYDDPYVKRPANGVFDTNLYEYSDYSASIDDPYLSYKGFPQYHARRGWLPGEVAIDAYDAKDIKFENFFLGGECGSMTNNKVMFHNYGTEANPQYEDYGTVYRITLPRGLTVHDKVVMGSENARIKYWAYTNDFKGLDNKNLDGTEKEPIYTFEGGVAPHTSFSYDLVYYNYHVLKHEGTAPNQDYNADGSYMPADYRASESSFWKGDTLLVRGDYLHYKHTHSNADIDKWGTADYCTDTDNNTEYYTSVTVDADGNPLFNADGTVQTTRKRRDSYGLTLYIDPVTRERRPYMGWREGRHKVKAPGAEYPTANPTVVKLTAVCAFDPHNKMAAPGDHSECYGGIIYGGCYTNGVTIGDVILNVGSDMLGEHVSSDDAASFGDISSLKYNIGRIFGGGYGQQSVIQGNTYVNLLNNVRAMNVFGGGMMGPVEGSTNVNYIGSDRSYIFGSIYGGGFRGSVGRHNGDEVLDETATHVNVFSGNVDRVYGGSCIGNLYGGAKVLLCDEVIQNLDHLDYERLIGLASVNEWSNARLIAGNVFGGNDISGNIYHRATAANEAAPFDADVLLREEKSVDGSTPSTDLTGNEPAGVKGKDTPGSENGYNGFPLVGNLYGGSNGDYGRHAGSKYATGSIVEFATGVGSNFETVDLGNPTGATDPEDMQPFDIPNLDRSRVTINGGTVINVYGGGDRASINESTTLHVQYNAENRIARAGFADEEDFTRMWNTCRLSSEQQINEVSDTTVVEDKDGNKVTERVFKFQVYRIFGGNNHADMAIQPTWELVSGYIGSIYSGANFGRMTHYKDGNGLTLTINSPTVRADAVYGGGRVGDVEPDLKGATPPADIYGTTLNISDGIIAHVYGGNDVSGRVHYGSKVSIMGAISGDVYCAGNGNYLYKYDHTRPAAEGIAEEYDDDYGGRYFVLPYKEGFGGDSPQPEHKIMAINSYRPNVEKTTLHIAGRKTTVTDDHGVEKEETVMAYVHGSVYMGGNSATVIPGGESGVMDNIVFDVGDDVILNRIYMGSNGESLVNPTMMRNTERINGELDLTDANTLTGPDMQYYPRLLDLYMRAVETEGKPNGFRFSTNTTNAYIGDFFVGGNRGSMITDRTITLDFPRNLYVYGKIVGGCNTSNVTYTGYTHHGGLTRPLANGDTDKVHLTVRSMFVPKQLEYPVNNDIWHVTLTDDVVDDKFYTRGRCNVFGGCYNSGTTVGNIKIDLYSDMLDYGVPEGTDRRVDILKVLDGINDKQWRTFSVIGGGFGAGTTVKGDINIRLLPEVTGSGDTRTVHHPSCASIFGGSQEGTVVGNTTVELRDGTVFTNVYGASEAAFLYGSTQILVGYPQYYVCNDSRGYALNRADQYSRQTNATNSDGTPVVKKTVWYRAGDLVAQNVYDQISDADKADCFTLHTPETPATYGAVWDDININVGDPASRLARTPQDIAAAPFYGHGNIYGGGFVSTSATVSLAGKATLKRFDATHLPDALSEVEHATSYGGNSSIMIGDNPDNANPAYTWADGTYSGAIPTGAAIRDHVSIGTAHFVAKTLAVGEDKMGYFCYEPDTEHFQHQPSGEYTQADKDAGKQYYYVEADGGIYGGGRKVFCDGFRACDISYYGYADYTPQAPKLINSFQRLDLLSLTDCCLQLQGANDFATNKVDATVYSMTRIGELRMNSSLAGTAALEEGERDNAHLGNIRHEKPRERNFLGFYNSVKYLGAFVSNVSFDNAATHTFHSADGAVQAATYRATKQAIIDDYYPDKPDSKLTSFKQRNLGTAANMIGICNGHQLKIQGAVTDGDGNDHIYYGPAIGVTEVKLLTLAIGEGGGYIYALNKHAEEADETPSFLQDLGNFVFPGAAFLMKADGTQDPDNLNYIIDDCYPVGSGYDEYMADTHNAGNVNNAQEIHYWYVNGQRYFYNATLTAYTAERAAEPKRFHLNNDDNLIMLPGIQADSENLRIKSITWTAPDGIEHDLLPRHQQPTDEATVLIPGYNLYLSLDHDPDNILTPASTDKNGGWVAELTRGEFAETLDGSGNPVPDGVVNLAYDGNGPFGDKTVSDGQGGTTTMHNTPHLGVMLTDDVDNNALEYYQQYLSEPINVKVVIAADNPAESGTGTAEKFAYEYTLNLNIVYLKGASAKGNIIIENCALPGELIYANAFDVKPETDDDNLYVSSRRWYIYKDLGNNSEMKRVCLNEDGSTEFLVDPNNEKRIAIPAYWWMNGWKLVYEVTMNGVPVTKEPEQKPDDPNHLTALTVHNYHRMYAWDYITMNPYDMTKPLHYDLQLTAGARVYIKNARDMKWFAEYLRQDNVMEDGRTTNRDRHRGHIGSVVLPEEYNDEVFIDPQHAKDVMFFLQNDISIDEAGAIVDNTRAATTPYNSELVFAGIFSGDGHVLKLGNCTNLFANSTGSFYNTGFYSSRPDVTVFRENHGRMLSCFYYNDNAAGPAPAGASQKVIKQHRGQFLGDGYLGMTDCDYQNCYQNVCQGRTDNYGLTTYFADQDFLYGRTGYNLNVLYLNERYNRSPEVVQTPSEYVPAYYYDGEYRYARYDSKGVGTATALRTDSFPNYMDGLGRGIIPAEVQRTATGEQAAAYGRRSTHHNIAHLKDMTRFHEDHYEPIYPKDYIFFGQDLSSTDETRFEKYPHAVTPDTRIYRASGFYGTREDRSFWFNRTCVARNPELTAIDFTGKRTREREAALAGTSGGSTYEVGLYQWPMSQPERHRMQRVFYPPVLDLPNDDADKTARMEGTAVPADMRLKSFDVIGDETVNDTMHITKNLLVYVHDNAPSVKAALTYTENMLPVLYTLADVEPQDLDPGAVVGESLVANNIQPDDQDMLRGHRLVWNPATDTYSATDGLFHLVDKQDFNAPIDFSVGKRAWYYRLPATFSNGNTAWEGICLPFTATRVRGSDYSPYSNPVRNHGELSHFYGPEPGKGSVDGENILHEYWLRSLTGYHTETKDGVEHDVLEFTRPLYKDLDGIPVPYWRNAAHTDTIAFDKDTYHYSNTWFPTTYARNNMSLDFYNQAMTAQQYTTEGRDFKDYPFLTHAVPYVVSFPGAKYYEFSMSGEFYAKQFPQTPDVYPQMVTYEYVVDNATLANHNGQVLTIRATDSDSPATVYGTGSYTLTGTYAHRLLSANESVVITPQPKDWAREPVMGAAEVDDTQYEDPTANGTYFAHRQLVRPFRVYLTAPDGGASHSRKYIGTRVATAEELPYEEERSLQDELGSLRVYVHDGKLHIDSPYDGLLPLYTISGIYYRRLHVHEGTNVYPDLHRGVYIVARKKVALH